MRRMSTRAHGVLDYSTAVAWLALPRAAGWTATTKRLMTGGALFALAYSLLTRYELGLIRVLPMKAHLALDGAFGTFFLAQAARARDLSRGARAVLLAPALIGLSAPFITETESPVYPAP